MKTGKKDIYSMQRPVNPGNRTFAVVMTGAMILCFVLVLMDLSLGSVNVPVPAVLRVLTGRVGEQELWHKVIFMIRMPRVVSAVLAGSALAVAGLQMQTLFHNPLAGPSVLGITAGASFGVALVMLTGGGAASLYAVRELGVGGSWLIAIASAIGAAAVMGVILLTSLRLKDNISLLIVGIMIGNITVSIVSIWQYFSQPEQIQDYLMWTFGSLGGVTNDQLYIFAVVVVIGLVIGFANVKALNTLLLGENYARSMGLNIRTTRLVIIITTSLLTGAVTGFCGPIAFVGIAVPHMARSLMGTSNHRLLVPLSMILGAALMLGCDLVARMPGSTMTLPINAITAVLGSPIVVWVILKNRNLRTAF